MAQRNLTKKYEEFRNNHKANRVLRGGSTPIIIEDDAPNRPLVGGTYGADEGTGMGTSPSLPSVFFEHTKKIDEQIMLIQMKSKQLLSLNINLTSCYHSMYSERPYRITEQASHGKL
jgi:hypothetical protein